LHFTTFSALDLLCCSRISYPLIFHDKKNENKLPEQGPKLGDYIADVFFVDG